MLRFTTENGSVYEIDEQTRTWARISHADWSNQVRTDSGPYREFRYGLDGSLIIIGPPLEDLNADCRMIQTSPVVDVERFDPLPGG
jgi:hypothetical protein